MLVAHRVRFDIVPATARIPASEVGRYAGSTSSAVEPRDRDVRQSGDAPGNPLIADATGKVPASARLPRGETAVSRRAWSTAANGWMTRGPVAVAYEAGRLASGCIVR